MSRNIVITGGTSGIGLALKELFEKNGDNVLTFSIDESDSPNHYQGSVSHEIKVNQVFNDIHEKYGTIDMLINCAGFGMSAITEIAPMEKIRDVMEVNFFGTLYCTRASLRYMNAGARIVNLSSAMALFPVPFKSIYGASKSAVLSLSMTMKMELAPAGIDVVAICPGDTKTNFTKNRIKEFETTERYGDRLKTSTEHNDSKENKRMSVDFVANQIFKIVNKKKTKPFYIVGGKYKFLYFLTRLTPKSLLINITGKKLGGKMEENPPKKVKPVANTEDTSSDNVMLNTATFTTLNDVTEPEEVIQSSENTNMEDTSINTQPENPSTISQEEAKNNISNILSKITILNKPSEQKAEAQEVSENEQVVDTNNNSFSVNTQAEETPASTSINATENSTQVVEEQPTNEQPTNEQIVNAQATPVASVENTPVTNEPTSVVNTAPTTAETQTTPVIESVVTPEPTDVTNSTPIAENTTTTNTTQNTTNTQNIVVTPNTTLAQTTTPSTNVTTEPVATVQPTNVAQPTTVEEPVVSNIQFDDEDDDTSNN